MLSQPHAVSATSRPRPPQEDLLDLNRIRSQLDADFIRLSHQLGGTLTLGSLPPDTGAPAADGASGSGAQRSAWEHAGTVRALHETAAALYRLDSGTYGICDSCDQPIEATRLRDAPCITMCLRCQQLSDRH